VTPRLGLAISLLLAACSSSAVSVEEVEALPPTTPVEVRVLLEESEVPVVLNVWASWCTPCRSEAPLLRRAHAEQGDDVRFVGIDVRDDQDGARAFIAEFGLDGFDHFFDESGAVPADLAAYGVPLTFFFAPGGELIELHSGVIDERTLALQIDELLRR
jgi:cytochrome c biogenesis protein CcmG/thiol:disulfide interchange protein DsbE